MKQTAVEWLKKELEQYGSPSVLSIDWTSFDGIIKQAIEMEKEQIIYSYSEAWHDGQDVIINQINHVDLGGDKAGEQYYNITYKPNKP